jgi:hypothetical protein
MQILYSPVIIQGPNLGPPWALDLVLLFHWPLSAALGPGLGAPLPLALRPPPPLG